MGICRLALRYLGKVPVRVSRIILASGVNGDEESSSTAAATYFI